MNGRAFGSAWRWLAAALALAAVVAVASTARVFSATVDEPAHLAAGMEWLSTGRYTYDLPHPPLGRLAIAIGPYLRGSRTTGATQLYDEGAAIIGSGAHYVDTLASARHGVLVFLVVLCLAVWAWGRRALGEAGAALAVFFAVTNPTILAHAGLATTDLACAATTTLALYAAVRWAQRPTMLAAVLAGAAAGTAVASRLSALAFVAGPLVVLYGLKAWAERRWSFGDEPAGRTWGQVGAAVVALLAVVLAVYRFDPRPFIEGIKLFVAHGDRGHYTYLLGTPGFRGWWYYFPIALLVKTPLPLLALAIVGAAVAVRDLRRQRDWAGMAPLVAAATILAISLRVHVDLGVRLVLPIYPLMAIVAAQGALALWAQAPRRTAQTLTVTLSGAGLVIAIRAHPDHLAYFNALAGDHPERILVDSNLDWGQDLYRLRDTLRARGVTDSVYIAYFGTTSPDSAGIPKSRFMELHERPTGWIAASETFLAGEWVGSAYFWLKDEPPIARIGPGMRLWYIPPRSPPATTAPSPR